MGKKLKKFMLLAAVMCLSVSFTFTSFAVVSNRYDSKSGMTNIDIPRPPRYENSEGQVVLSSAEWIQAQAFFEGYAIVCKSQTFIDIYSNWYTFAIIDESGKEISTFEMGGSIYLKNKEFYRFVDNPEGYVWWFYSSSEDGLTYVTGKLDGTLSWYSIPELSRSDSDSEYTHEYYTIGTFRNGSANIYKVNSYTPIFGGYKNHSAVGSITIEGVYSTSINKESKYADEVIPAYGTKQFAENRVTAGWKEDSAGWWYDNGDGTYPKNQWKEIEGKQYYFGEDGYMYQSQYTPDGYWVDENGVWIESEPQINPDEVEKRNTLGWYIEMFGELYENKIFVDAENFEDYVRNFIHDMSEEDINYIINEVRSNYTFVPA